MTKASATAHLEVSLSAIVHNYRLLASRLKSGRCSAAVKADAYGLGVEAVAPALADVGCRDFFVATLEEGIQMSDIGCRISQKNPVRIYVINGLGRGEEKEYATYGLIPVLNTLEQITRWARFAENTSSSGIRHSTSVLQIDTGMNRLGLTTAEQKNLDAALVKKARITMVMSHLACADEPEHAMNEEQLARFRWAQKIPAFAGMTNLEWSLANSSGIFLGADYHFDLARPGCALYGINPTPEKKNPMKPVATLTAPILQIRTLEKRGGVGYGSTHIAQKGDRIATLGVGYADGFFRHLGNQAHGFIGKYKVPVVGRVSMDMVMVDVTKVPQVLLTKELRVEFIGPHQDVDSFAEKAGTIGYEVFTRLGSRVKRIYSTETVIPASKP